MAIPPKAITSATPKFIVAGSRDVPVDNSQYDLNITNAVSASSSTSSSSGNESLLNNVSQTNGDPASFLLDSNWIKQSFLVSNNQLSNNVDILNRYWSSATSKFTSATIGGNIGINNRPQFTRYADIRVKGRLPGRSDVSLTATGGNYGMGRYYSEAIDDNVQKIFLRFGVPQYNSISTFMLGAASPDMVQMARTGRISKAYTLGKVAGTIGMFLVFPVLSTLVYATSAFAKIFSTIMANPTSKYYTMKPTMYMYWSAVNMLVNSIGVNKGLIPSFINNVTGTKSQRINNLYGFDTAEMQDISAMFPGLMDDAGYFDVFAIAARVQVLSNILFEADYNAANAGTPTNYTGFLKKENISDPRLTTYVSNPDGGHGLIAFINKTITFGSYFTSDNKNAAATSGIELDPRGVTNPVMPATTTPQITDTTTMADTSNATVGSNSNFTGDYLKYLDATFRTGAEFAVFQVDYTQSVSESFSNSAVESELENKINSMSSEKREARFTFENGNIIGGAVGSAIETTIGAVTDVVAGTLNAATFGLAGGLMATLGLLAGNGFIDIPKHWQSASASLPRSTYNIQLTSPYGNVISQMTNIYIPLCMLLAGVLPLSTGKQSYTSPFLVQLWDRGRAQIQLGMIESLTITRGVSNLGFTNMGNPLAIDVSFSIMDLSSIMHMPVSTGSLFSANTNMDADNILMDYLAVLAGQDIYSQIYALPRAKLNLAKYANNFKKFASPAWRAETTVNILKNTPILGTITNGVEGLVLGNSAIVNPISN